MKKTALFVLGLAMMFSATLSAKECQVVSGKITETTVVDTNSPFGRALAIVSGTLNGAKTAIITGFIPGPGDLNATTVEAFTTGAGETLNGTGVAAFTSNQDGSLADTLNITITGGTGKWAGATGSIEVVGTGYNVFSAPGDGYFLLSYKGVVCRDK